MPYVTQRSHPGRPRLVGSDTRLPVQARAAWMATLTTRCPVNENKSVQDSPASAWAARKPACVLPLLQTLPAMRGQPGRSWRCTACVNVLYVTQCGHRGRPRLLGSDMRLPVQARAAWMATLTMRSAVDGNKSARQSRSHHGAPGRPCVRYDSPTFARAARRTVDIQKTYSHSQRPARKPVDEEEYNNSPPHQHGRPGRLRSHGRVV